MKYLSDKKQRRIAQKTHATSEVTKCLLSIFCCKEIIFGEKQARSLA